MHSIYNKYTSHKQVIKSGGSSSELFLAQGETAFFLGGGGSSVSNIRVDAARKEMFIS